MHRFTFDMSFNSGSIPSIIFLSRSLIETPPQPMIPTFVFGWPTGTETGDYLALDLGKSNFSQMRIGERFTRTLQAERISVSVLSLSRARENSRLRSQNTVLPRSRNRKTDKSFSIFARNA